MIKNAHKLSLKKDRWFLEQNKQDEYLLETFSPGDIVVVCANCHRVWLEDTWQVKQRCPNGQCHCTKTEVFSKKNRIRTKRDSKIRIVKNANSGFIGGEKIASVIVDWLENINSSTFLPLDVITTCVLCVTLVASIILSAIKSEEKELSTDIEHIYYQETLENKRAKILDSFMDTILESKLSIEDTMEHIKIMGSKVTKSVQDSLEDILVSVTDTYDKTEIALEEDVEKTENYFLNAIENLVERIDEIKEEYGIGE